MSLDSLPPELILYLGNFLGPKSLAALTSSAKRFALLLYPQLYTKWIQLYCASPVTYRSSWSSINTWTSQYAVDYFTRVPTHTFLGQDCSTLVHHFAGAGNLHLLDIIIRQGADVNAKNEDGVIPLHLAAYQGHLDVVQALSDLGADINAVDRYCQTPLHMAVRGGHLDVTGHLLKLGADVFTSHADGASPFEMVVIHGLTDFSRIFISSITRAKGDINTPGAQGYTVLHLASWQGYIPIVEYLLAHHADPFGRTSTGDTALNLACKQGHTEVVKLLLEAGAESRSDILAPNLRGVTPFHNAVACGCISLIELLLDSDSDLLAVDVYGKSAIDRALDGPEDVFQLLLRRGPAFWPEHRLQPRLSLDSLWSRLSTEFGWQAVTRIIELVSTGRAAVDLSAPFDSERTILHVASSGAYMHRRFHKLILSLVNAGADVDIAEHGSGDTPIHIMLRLVIDCSNRGEYIEIIQKMIHASKALHKLNNEGNSYLHFAARKGAADIVELLLSLMRGEPRSVLDDTVGASADGVTTLELSRGSFDVNAGNSEAMTALHWAARGENFRCIRLLVEAGANPWLLDDAGNPPAHYAVCSKNEAALDYFAHLGAADHERCDVCMGNTTRWKQKKQIRCGVVDWGADSLDISYLFEVDTAA